MNDACMRHNDTATPVCFIVTEGALRQTEDPDFRILTPGRRHVYGPAMLQHGVVRKQAIRKTRVNLVFTVDCATLTLQFHFDNHKQTLCLFRVYSTTKTRIRLAGNIEQVAKHRQAIRPSKQQQRSGAMHRVFCGASRHLFGLCCEQMCCARPLPESDARDGFRRHAWLDFASTYNVI